MLPQKAQCVMSAHSTIDMAHQFLTEISDTGGGSVAQMNEEER